MATSYPVPDAANSTHEKDAFQTQAKTALISTTSAHDPSPSAPISTSLKTQATYPPSVRERVRKHPPAVAPPISRRSPIAAVNVSRRLAGFQPSALSAAAIARGLVPAA